MSNKKGGVIPDVTIFCENKLLRTKNGFESFTILPVKIIDGVVSNRKEPDTYAKAQSR